MSPYLIPLSMGILLKRAPLKPTPIMKRLNQTPKFLRTAHLQQNLPESQSIHGLKHFQQVNESVLLFSAFLLQLPTTENHVYCSTIRMKAALRFRK